MLRKAAFITLPAILAALSACTSAGDLKNPFVKEPPFVATPVPADLEIIVDENHDTYYARQHIQQVISAADSMSHTTYTTYRDYNNVVSNRFTVDTPLSQVQLQDIWNDISRNQLLRKSRLWINWLADSDLYKRDSYTIQIRANGRAAVYRQTNGFSGAVRPLMLELEALRLPITQNSATPVVGAAENPPASQPAAIISEPPATEPMIPETQPATPAATQ